MTVVLALLAAVLLAGTPAATPAPARRSPRTSSAEPSRCAVVEAAIDASGVVTGVRLVRPSRDPELDRRALEELSKRRYEPTVHGGKKIPIYLTTAVCPHPPSTRAGDPGPKGVGLRVR